MQSNPEKSTVLVAAIIMTGFAGTVFIFADNAFAPLGDNKQQEPALFYVSKYHERPSVSIINIQGFVTVKPVTSGAPPLTRNADGFPTNPQLLGVYEFVLKPDSKGSMFAIYDCCPDCTAINSMNK